jgi:pyridoxine/pyridoxamine 5'-phosphate oxidase
VPNEFEFWQNNVNHLDDRIQFTKTVEQDKQDLVTAGEHGWFIERLCP